jgi:hypothetical protein
LHEQLNQRRKSGRQNEHANRCEDERLLALTDGAS